MAFNDGARKAENRSPDKDTDAAAAPHRPRYRDNDDDDDDDDDDDAFDNNDDAEKRIGEITKPPHGSGGDGGGITPDDLYGAPPEDPHSALSQRRRTQIQGHRSDMAPRMFPGIMGSFVVYGLLLEYTTSRRTEAARAIVPVRHVEPVHRNRRGGSLRPAGNADDHPPRSIRRSRPNVDGIDLLLRA